jgi:hypothetical protein
MKITFPSIIAFFCITENLLLIYSPSGHLKCRWLNPWSLAIWKWRGSITLRVKKKSRYRKQNEYPWLLTIYWDLMKQNNEHNDCTLTSLPVMHSLNINTMFNLVCFKKYPLLPQAHKQTYISRSSFFFFFSSALLFLESVEWQQCTLDFFKQAYKANCH